MAENLDAKKLCKVCGEEITEDIKDHNNTLIHIEAQKKKYGEIECNICKEKFVAGYAKEHKKTTSHILIAEQQKATSKLDKSKHHLGSKQETKEKETYILRQGSEENQQYINTLTTFFALRFAFIGNEKDFKVSVNNEDWKQFGDIVIEFTNTRDKKKEIVAVRCKRIETKYNYSIDALTTESKQMSLKEHCETLEILKKNEGFENASFKLYTVSNVEVDSHSKFIFDGECLDSWKQEADKKLWKGREFEIKQPKYTRKKDLFNTTDDSGDICTFTVTDEKDKDLAKKLEKFKMYINQKLRTDLEALINNMIEDKFNIPVNISEDLIKYVTKYFKTHKVSKNKQELKSKKPDTSFKMAKEDFLLKVAELLLLPFLIFPDHSITAIDLDLWNSTIKEFDVVLMDNNSDSIEKIYRTIHFIVQEKTQYSVDVFNKVTADKTKVTDVNLRTKIFEDCGNDQSLQFLYLALWKSGLIPLVLQAENEKQLMTIVNVISLFKKETFSLKFIIITNCKVDRIYFPHHLKVFLNLADTKIVNDELLTKILDEKINFLNFVISLKDIDSCNSDFRQKLTPDALLNIFFGDYSFKDFKVPITTEIADSGLVLEDELIDKITNCFPMNENTSDKGLSYLVNVKGKPNYVQVPPRL